MLLILKFSVQFCFLACHRGFVGEHFLSLLLSFYIFFVLDRFFFVILLLLLHIFRGLRL